MKLDLPGSENVFVKKMSQRLRKKFSINSEEDQYRVLQLGLWLIALSEYEQANSLFRSFVLFEEQESREDDWDWIFNSFIALAYLEKRQGNIEAYERFMGIVEKFSSTGIDDRRSTYIKDCLDSNVKILAYLDQEEIKNSSELLHDLSFEFMTFLQIRVFLLDWEKASFMTRRHSTKVDDRLTKMEGKLLEVLNRQ